MNNLNINLHLEFDDMYNPIIQLRDYSKYTIIYFTKRNDFSYLIDNPTGLVKHYVRVYNQAFCQNKSPLILDQSAIDLLNSGV